MKLDALVGSGKKIGLFTLPFLIIIFGLNYLYPSLFLISEPSVVLKIVSAIVGSVGVLVWLWSVILILTKIPKGRLITTGPYAMVKHPLYTGVALLVLPWIGFLLNTWIGLMIGIVVYIGSRIFSPQEEKFLSKMFGEKWKKYSKEVRMPWI